MARARSVRRFLYIVVAALAVAVAVFFYLRRTPGDGAGQYRTAVVDRGDVTMTVTATGTLSAVTTVQVGSQVSGIISALYADFNSPVKKGQLVAELDPTPFQTVVEQRRGDLARAEVDRRNADITLKRQKRLFAEGLTTQADLDGAQAGYDGTSAQVEQTKAALRQVETNLRYTRILSPIDGVVVDRQYDVGQTVAASFQAPTLFTIAQDLTKMQVQADVDQSDIGRVRVGLPAHFTVDAYPEEEFRGTIAQVRLNATAIQNVITYPVILEVANPEEKLRPKMTADVTIEVETVRDVLRVPNAALRFRPEGKAGAAGASPTGAQGASPARGHGAAPARGGREQDHGAGAARAGGAPAGGFAAVQGVFPQAGAAPEQSRRTDTVYVLEGGKDLKPYAIRTGLSDGRYSQVVEGELQPGMTIVVGVATSKVTVAPGAAGPPGFGRRF